MGCMTGHHSFPAPPFGYYVLVPMPMAQTQVREIEVDAATTTKTAFTGGWADSRLTVEYYVDAGADAASVTLTMVVNGQTTTWNDQAIAAGYHVHEQLPPLPPGAKLILQATSALARLRWCESICC